MRAWVLVLCMACACAAQVPPEAGAPVQVPATAVQQSAAPAENVPQAALPNHRLVPDDLISVQVFEEPELSKDVRVDSDGMIALPVVTKKIHAADLMPRELEAEITRELLDEKILVHPVVSVSILEYASGVFTVVGDVKEPGQFRINGPITLLEALARAGWITDKAGPVVLLASPDSPTPRRIDIRQLQSMDPKVNVALKGGETITVPDVPKPVSVAAEEGYPDGPKVWIVGSLAKPVAYSLANAANATVLHAVRSVKLLLPYDKTAYIYRAGEGGKRIAIKVPLKEIVNIRARDIALEADDVLFIPAENDSKLPKYYEAHPPSPPWELFK